MAITLQGPWMATIVLACVAGVCSEYLMGGHMDNNPSKSLLEETESPGLARTAQLGDLDLDLEAEESTVSSPSPSDEESLRYHLPYPFAFNGGRPFSLEKDPITGKIDFEKAPPVKALNYTDRYQDHATEKENAKENAYLAKKKLESVDVSPNEINSPNFHDFLNLPVHYSSDKYGKDKYPLISSSYANTKVQSGSNSYSTYNHKPYHGETVLYFPTRKPYAPKATSTTDYTTVRTTPMISTTSSTTSRPVTSTTIASTRITTTTMSSTSSTMPSPSTKSYASTKPPVITTWKPPTTTPKRFIEHLDDYEEILPIEKLQASMLSENHRNVVQQDREQPPRQDEYLDGYEDYEVEDAKDYVSSKESEAAGTTATVPGNATTVRTSETATTTSAPPAATFSSAFSESSHRTNAQPYQGHAQRPVTSMPLDIDPRLPSALETDNRRHGVDNIVVNQSYRPNPLSQRPNAMGGGILVESTSNIVIPPDQDTVSFVLGNRQNVEGYYSLGTAIGENPYGSNGVDPSFRPLYGGYDPQGDHRGTVLPSSENDPPAYAAQTWSNPPTQKLGNEVDSSRVQSSFAKGTVLLDQPEEKGEKDANFVVFPKDEPSRRPVEEHVVVVNEADGTVHEVAPSSTTAKSVRTQDPFASEERLPQLSESLTPPAERPRPPPQFYYHYHHGGTARPEHLRPQRLPSPPRGKQPVPPPPPPPPPSPEIGIRRRPYAPDASLPNILPQFRPNAKTSHGHRGPESIGTIPAPQGFPTRVRQPVQHSLRRPLPPPSYLQRLNPPPPPIHALRVAGAAKPEGAPPLEKRFRVPVTSRGDEDAKSTLSQKVGLLASQKLRVEEEDRADQYSEEPPQVPPRPPMYPKRRGADPPRVATLQMIQQRGDFEDEESRVVQDAERIVDQDAERTKLDDREAMAESPVYVVYPVNTAVNIHPDDSREKDESVVVGTRGPHWPLPPETLLQEDDKHDPPVRNVFNGRPPLVSDFPYPLERPDASMEIRETPLLIPSDQRDGEEEDPGKESEEKEEKDSSVNVIPYLQDFVPFPARNEAISATLHRAPHVQSSTPIAYVYTPTAQASHRLDVDRDQESPKQDHGEQKPVLLPSQQPSSSSSSAPSPQNFMAPFVASVSAEAPSKNGWSVVVVEPTINRKSDDSVEEDSEAEDSQTERSEFDPENFKPQLFGGFKPIYEFPAQDADRPEQKESEAPAGPQQSPEPTV